VDDDLPNDRSLEPEPDLARERLVVTEHSYKMTGRVRPALAFWVSRDDVGGARIAWQCGADGRRGWEMLIGSDPLKTPGGVNRWGYIREQVSESGASTVGVMKDGDDQTLDHVQAHAGRESREGYRFTLLRSRVEGDQSIARTVARVFPRDFTYHDLDDLLAAFDAGPAGAGSGTRSLRLAPEVRPGFLAAVADLVARSLTAFASGAPQGELRIQYAYNGTLYDLTMKQPRVVEGEQIGGRRYPILLRAAFETLNRTTGNREAFTVAYGVTGPIAGVPVFIAYQPRWWFKAELVLVEQEA
jgi:hypothetical protein